MRAAVCPDYGPPEVVRIENRPSPPLEPGQARVRVGAAAVNYPDVLLVANHYQVSVPAPFVVGSRSPGWWPKSPMAQVISPSVIG